MLYFTCIHTVCMRKVFPYIFASTPLFGYCSSVCGLILKSELSSNINCSEIFLVF